MINLIQAFMGNGIGNVQKLKYDNGLLSVEALIIKIMKIYTYEINT